MYGIPNPFGMPGMTSAQFSNESNLFWSSLLPSFTQFGGVLSASAADAGNTPTTTLRGGLILAYLPATGQWTTYNPANTDGSQIPAGVLGWDVNTLDPQTNVGTAQNIPVILFGCLRAANLIGLDENVRRQFFGRIWFDDQVTGASRVAIPEIGFNYVVAKTASYTILNTDNNTMFTNKGATGAIVFTLPTVAPGLRFKFYIATNQNVTITAPAAGTITAYNNAAVTNIAFSTANQLLGASVEIFANEAGTGWYAIFNLANGSQTVTLS